MYLLNQHIIWWSFQAATDSSSLPPTRVTHEWSHGMHPAPPWPYSDRMIRSPLQSQKQMMSMFEKVSECIGNLEKAVTWVQALLQAALQRSGFSVSHANDWLRVYLCVQCTTLQKTVAMIHDARKNSSGQIWSRLVHCIVFRFWCTYHWTQWKVLVGAKNCMLGSHPY